MHTLTFKAPAEVAAFIRRQAETHNTSVSDFMRSTFTAMLPKQRCKIVKRNGYLVVVHPPGTPPITDEDIRAAEDADDIAEASR